MNVLTAKQKRKLRKEYFLVNKRRRLKDFIGLELEFNRMEVNKVEKYR